MKIIHRKPTNINVLEEWNLDPVLSKIFMNRGISSLKELVYPLKNLLPPNFADIDKAASIIGQAIINNDSIRIIGDYDVDGATSTALAMRFFNDIEYKKADYYIPRRNEDGYGLNPSMVLKAQKDGINLIITVDNGISAYEAINKADNIGIKVVVTDHHVPGKELPKASAIVNPKRADCLFESKNIAGVGVCFYVMTAVRTFLRDEGWFEKNKIQEPKMSDYLDLVALGTVSDVVPMDYNNRIMVQHGISLIRQKRTTNGIAELIKISGQKIISLTSTDISFSLSPKLNAAGRIDDMSYGVDCLIANDAYKAKLDANILYNFNLRRKDLEKDMEKIADHQIKKIYKGDTSKGLMLYHQDFYSGICGIIASKLTDRYHVPVAILAYSGREDLMTGSFRSVPGFNIHDFLETSSNNYPDLLKSWGGHAMAGGVTLPIKYFEFFRKIFSEAVQNFAKTKIGPYEVQMESDGVLPDTYFIPAFARALVFDQPWGEDFPNPTFDGIFILLRQTVIKNHLRLKLQLQSGQVLSAIYYFYDPNVWPNNSVRMIRAVYCFQIGRNSDDGAFGLIVRAMEPVTESLPLYNQTL